MKCVDTLLIKYLGAIDSELIDAAESTQIEAFESDEREGLVREYLDKLLPSNWDEMELYKRRNFFSENTELEEKPVGTVVRQSVCILEI